MERLSACIRRRAAQKGTLGQAIGRSKGGLTTTILALVYALGNLVRLSLWPGQRHDSTGVPDLIDGLTFEPLLGDNAFDNNAMRVALEERGARIREQDAAACQATGRIAAVYGAYALHPVAPAPRKGQTKAETR